MEDVIVKKVYMLYFIFANEDTVILGIFSSFKKALEAKFSLSKLKEYRLRDLEIASYDLNVIII